MEQFKRIISALVILPPLILFLSYAPAGLFLCLILLLIGLSLREYFALLAQIQLPTCAGVSYAVAWLLPVSAHFGSWRWLSMALFFSLVALTVGVMVTSQEVTRLFPMLLYSAFGMCFIGWTLSHFVLLRGLPEGQWYVLLLCSVVWVGDSVAMYVGKSLGQHKMAPFLSPGKTWEGAAGGTVGSVLAALLGARVLFPQLLFWHSVVLGLLIALVAPLSDLGESMLKRYTGVKDSGGLIPGHGGILDRIDSLLFATPTFVYALVALGHVSSP
jgi:phosphatidate cytidylyltransferase